MIAIAPGRKLLPVMVNVTWLPIVANPIFSVCCATLTLAIDGGGGVVEEMGEMALE
jgi:hypothetical protein